MEAIIVNYRRGRRTQTTNQMVLFVPKYDKEKAKTLVGKKVTYTCEGKDKKQIVGRISAVHGNSGAVRALFETGMPGQAIGGKISIN
ncbi:MAG: 50S ribosomal protein L35ae [Nanoarchaeota archaeon]|nr:50S ribosomal protein L35ae [Nanoarchaeota archaeon]